MRLINIIITSFALAIGLLAGVAQADSDKIYYADDYSEYISEAKRYVKENSAELSSLEDVKYEILSTNKDEVIVSVISTKQVTRTEFNQELNEFIDLTETMIGSGLQIHFLKADQKFSKVWATQ